MNETVAILTIPDGKYVREYDIKAWHLIAATVVLWALIVIF